MKKIAIVSGTCGEEEKRKQQNVAKKCCSDVVEMLRRAMEEPLRCNRCGKKAHNCKTKDQHSNTSRKKKNHERRKTIGNATEE